MMAKASSCKQNIIFVTRDRKEDYWNVTNKQITEKFSLLNEFYNETGQVIRMFEDVAFFELLTRSGLISEESKQTVLILRKENQSLDNYAANEAIQKLKDSAHLVPASYREFLKMSAPQYNPGIAGIINQLLDTDKKLSRAFQPFGGYLDDPETKARFAEIFTGTGKFASSVIESLKVLDEKSKQVADSMNALDEKAKEYDDMMKRAKIYSEDIRSLQTPPDISESKD